MSGEMPRPDVAAVDAGGRLTRPWRDAWQRMQLREEVLRKALGGGSVRLEVLNDTQVAVRLTGSDGAERSAILTLT
jgi:hypothetical protein